MRILDIILIGLATIETIALIVSFIYWVVLFNDYKNTAKHLRTIDGMDYPTEIAKLSADSKKHGMEIQSIGESFSQMNAKLTARWRREAKLEQSTPTNSQTVVYQDRPYPGNASELPPNNMSFLKKKKALFK